MGACAIFRSNRIQTMEKKRNIISIDMSTKRRRSWTKFDVGRSESGARSGGVVDERRGTYGKWERKSGRRGRGPLYTVRRRWVYNS
jgi:hypothetical protein